MAPGVALAIAQHHQQKRRGGGSSMAERDHMEEGEASEAWDEGDRLEAETDACGKG